MRFAILGIERLSPKAVLLVWLKVPVQQFLMLGNHKNLKKPLFIGGSSGILGQIEGGITDTVMSQMPWQRLMTQ
jgi:hypothetical protein